MNVQEALDTLLAQLRAALKAAQDEGAEAMRRSDFPAARKAAERGEVIQKHMAQLEALRRDLPGLVGGPPQPASRATARAVKGSATPHSAYRIPILQALVEMGGRGTKSEVLNRVYRAMEHRLKDVDREMIPSGGDVRWRKAASWERYGMTRDGLLAADSPSGIWEITDKGREYLREHGG